MFETLTERLSSAFQSLRGQRELNEKNTAEGLRSVRTALLEADVHFKVARDFTDRVRDRVLGEEVLKGVNAPDQFVHAVHSSLVELMGPEDARLVMDGAPTVILVAGLQGAGKTTTCAKLAKHLRDKHQKRPLMVAADVKRPAAVKQLQVLGEQTQIPVFHREGLDPAALCALGVEEARAKGCDVVLLDTAGRLHVDDELMEEVAEIARRTQPQNQVLVVDAMTGQDAVRSAEAFHSRLSLTGVILTKMDGDARGGAAVSLKAVTGCPILFLGTGEKIGDLDAFSPERMAGRILGAGDVVGLVEQAHEAIDEKEAQASFDQMVMGNFTLEDLLGQIRMIKKLGPLKKVMGMMPGMGQMLDKVDMDDNHMGKLEALFLSMTPRERLLPQSIDISRRRRIARGAGQEVGAVNQLLKMHKSMGQMMRKMGLSGGGGKATRKALKGMAPGGQLAGGAGGGMGLGDAMGALGGLKNLFGGGGGMPGAGDMDMGNPFGAARPMGSSATRKSGSKRKKQKKQRNKKRKR